jgi:hypothetical protein
MDDLFISYYYGIKSLFHLSTKKNDFINRSYFIYFYLPDGPNCNGSYGIFRDYSIYFKPSLTEEIFKERSK